MKGASFLSIWKKNEFTKKVLRSKQLHMYVNMKNPYILTCTPGVAPLVVLVYVW